MNKYILLLAVFCTALFTSCGDDNDVPLSDKNKLKGYWAITHVQVIEHIGELHNTFDKEIGPHYLDSYVSENIPRWDVLIFDEDFVTVRGDMPSRPKRYYYGDETPENEVLYLNDLENWSNAIGDFSDFEASPVGKYDIKSGKLQIGSLDMGNLKFISDTEFILDWKQNLSKSDFRQFSYTYSRIYSLYK